MKSPSNQGGYTKEEIDCMDYWVIKNVILHPRHHGGNRQGQLVISDKGRKETSLEEVVCHNLEKIGMRPHEVKKFWREYSKAVPVAPQHGGREMVPVEA